MKYQCIVLYASLFLTVCGECDVDIVLSEAKCNPVEERIRSGKSNNIYSLVVW